MYDLLTQYTNTLFPTRHAKLTERVTSYISALFFFFFFFLLLLLFFLHIKKNKQRGSSSVRTIF